VDDGFEEGMEIPIYYDPMIAKLVVHAPTRNEAIEKMCRAIDEYRIKGIKTTLQFGKWAIRTEPFRSGKFDTKFIEKYYKPEYLKPDNENAEKAAALLSAFIWQNEQETAKPHSAAATVSKWKLNRK
jgi:acetyl/propionyl-CoA carboxylase alpha subunit